MWTEPGLHTGMHSNQPVCVRSDTENVSGKFLVVGHFCTFLCIWILDKSGLLHPVTTCHNCSVCHESWQARVTMTWGELGCGMEIGEKPWLWSDPQLDSWDEELRPEMILSWRDLLSCCPALGPAYRVSVRCLYQIMWSSDQIVLTYWNIPSQPYKEKGVYISKSIHIL